MDRSEDKSKTLNVFIVYAREDMDSRKQLEKHISFLARKKYIRIWHDEKIESGKEWKKNINSELLNSDLIFFIVSSNFLASDYIYEIEMPTALDLHKDKGIPVIPIIMSPCHWDDASFSHLQVIPRNGKPIIKKDYNSTEYAFQEAASEIKQIVFEIINKREKTIESHEKLVETLRVNIDELTEKRIEIDQDLKDAEEKIQLIKDFETKIEKQKSEINKKDQKIELQKNEIQAKNSLFEFQKNEAQTKENNFNSYIKELISKNKELKVEFNQKIEDTEKEKSNIKKELQKEFDQKIKLAEKEKGGFSIKNRILKETIFIYRSLTGIFVFIILLMFLFIINTTTTMRSVGFIIIFLIFILYISTNVNSYRFTYQITSKMLISAIKVGTKKGVVFFNPIKSRFSKSLISFKEKVQEILNQWVS
jgi:TIR domain